MGNELIFFPLLIILVGTILMKENVARFFFNSFGMNVSPKSVLNVALVLLVLLVIYGVVFDDTKEKFSNISANYNQMRPGVPTEETTNKPHRFFDIDFDSLFPW